MCGVDCGANCHSRDETDDETWDRDRTVAVAVLRSPGQCHLGCPGVAPLSLALSRTVQRAGYSPGEDWTREARQHFPRLQLVECVVSGLECVHCAVPVPPCSS